MRIGILSAHPRGAGFESNARLLEEAKKAGAEASIINYKKTVAAIRGYGRQLLQVTENGSLEPIEVDVIIPRVGKDVEPGIRAIDVLTSNGVPTTAPSSAVLMAKDKFASLVQLDRGGIPVPYTVAPTGQTPNKSTKMIELIQPEKARPVIVKSLRGSKGRGVFISESRRSAVSQVEGLASNGIDYLVQEFIEPPSTEKRASDVRIFVIDGEVIAAMERTANVDDEFRSNLDLGGKALAYDPTPREREIALRSAEIIGARIVGFDGMHSYRGMLATEVNVNPGLGIEEVTGINVAGAMIQLALSLAEQKHNQGSFNV